MMPKTITMESSTHDFPEITNINYPPRPKVSGLANAHMYFSFFIAGLAGIFLGTCLAINYKFNPSSRTFKKWATRWANSVLAVTGVSSETVLRGSLEAGKPYIFVSNHQTSLDIILNLARIPYDFGFMAKAAMAKAPVLGLALRSAATVFVDRSSARKAVASIKAAGEQIKNGNSVLIYPEGTRSNGGEMGKFQRGAFQIAIQAGVPIVPVTLLGSYLCMDEKARTLMPGDVPSIIGKPISTEGLTKKDVPALMARVRHVMESEMADHFGTKES